MDIKKITRTLFVLALMLNNSCHQKDIVLIKGNIKNIPDGMIYLTDAYDWQTKILDSAQIKNGSFKFCVHPWEKFEPHETSLCFYNRDMKPERIVFEGIAHKGINNQPYGGGDAFMLEKGKIEIIGDIDDYTMYSMDKIFHGKVELKGGIQNEAYFNCIELRSIPVTNSIVPAVERLIHKYPDSYFLLRCIYENKEQYTREILSKLLGLFKSDVKNSQTGLNLSSYILRTVSTDIRYYLFQKPFHTVSGDEQLLRQTDSTLSLVVFWASWCGPCRIEIDSLKSVSSKIRSKVNIVSISLDADKQQWTNAVATIKMPWRQLWVGNNKVFQDSIKEAFRTSFIPVTILYNPDGTEQKRFTGFTTSEMQELSRSIDSLTSRMVN